jgi:arsenite methyltransferase
MNETDKIKTAVREKYAHIAGQSKTNEESCNVEGVSRIVDDYEQINGYVAEADLGLGCGVPTDSADIKPGDVVLDLGSGAGNDVFIARALVGEAGRVLGLDFTDVMIEKARANAAKLGFDNVEFHLGDIENLPFESESINVVISNCVLNLVPNKNQAFAEIYRVLTPGGHFSVSDVVIDGEMPPDQRRLAESYVGCVAGAESKKNYLRIIEQNGFTDIRIVRQRIIQVPGMSQEISCQETHDLNPTNQIVSITVYGHKHA